MDQTTYISTIIGMAAMLVKINNPIQSNTKEKGNLLVAHFIDLNFRANMGISATNKNENPKSKHN